VFEMQYGGSADDEGLVDGDGFGLGVGVSLGVGVAVTCDFISRDFLHPHLGQLLLSDGSLYIGRRYTQCSTPVTQVSRISRPSLDQQWEA
jgi:hypothetical protein